MLVLTDVTSLYFNMTKYGLMNLRKQKKNALKVLLVHVNYCVMLMQPYAVLLIKEINIIIYAASTECYAPLSQLTFLH